MGTALELAAHADTNRGGARRVVATSRTERSVPLGTLATAPGPLLPELAHRESHSISSSPASRTDPA